MKVIRAHAMGMCFGVKDALSTVMMMDYPERATGEKAGLPCFQVERASELRPEWFCGFDTVGLTAGTSTLDQTIDEVYTALVEMEVSCDATIRK